MRKFVGIECVIATVARDIDRQLAQDGCLCAACWKAFTTLYKSVPISKNVAYANSVYWRGERYWKKIKEANKQ